LAAPLPSPLWSTASSTSPVIVLKGDSHRLKGKEVMGTEITC
jgi:hypothetical protein